MSSISCIYINPTEIASIWEEVKPGIERCIDKGGLGIHTLDLVLKNLISGEWCLWVLYGDSSLRGFYVLNIVSKSHLEIVYGHLLSCAASYARSLKDIGLRKIEGVARAFKCKKILAYSTRVGMDRILSEDLGYTKEMVVYCKEIDETPEENSSH